jgi:hypothetical protein
METPDSTFRHCQNLQRTDCNALKEDECYRTAPNDDHTDQNSPADLSSSSLKVYSERVQSMSPRAPATMRKSPRFKHIFNQIPTAACQNNIQIATISGNSRSPKASLFRIKEHNDDDNWLDTSVSPFTPTSLRRNSTPFLNRPKAIISAGKAIVRALQIPANELSPVMNKLNLTEQASVGIRLEICLHLGEFRIVADAFREFDLARLEWTLNEVEGKLAGDFRSR